MLLTWLMELAGAEPCSRSARDRRSPASPYRLVIVLVIGLAGLLAWNGESAASIAVCVPLTVWLTLFMVARPDLVVPLRPRGHHRDHHRATPLA